MNRRTACFAFAFAALGLASACKKENAGGPTTGPSDASSSAVTLDQKKIRIAVIPKGTTHEFWKTVHAGAMKAARQANVDIIWKGPLKEDDLKAQIDVVESFVAQGISGIVLAPLSDKGLVGAVKGASRAKIPVVVFDSDLNVDDYVSFVATENVTAGAMAGTALAEAIGKKGNVMMLRYQEGSASTANREKGFLAAIKAFPDVRVVSDNQYGGATTESASKTSDSMIAALKVGEGAVQGIFTPNESTTFGMLLALRRAKLAGKVKHVGFDASEKLVAAIRQGELHGVVLQDPEQIGFRATNAMIDHLRGKKVEKRIDTGSRLATKANIENPEIRILVSPDLTGVLNE